MPAFIQPCLGLLSSTGGRTQVCSSSGGRIAHQNSSSFRGFRVPRRYGATAVPRESVDGWSTTRAVFGGGGILGVGPSEIVVIVAVGWLVLGPQKLFALAKDSGKLIGELRRTANEAKDTFSEALDVDLMVAEMELASQTEKDTQKDKERDSNNKDANGTAPLGQESDDESASDLALDDTPSALEDTESDGNDVFLEQLRRVSDPKQSAPSEVPDLSLDLDELEVERLERDYNAAKRRLEGRRQQANADSSPPVESGAEER